MAAVQQGIEPLLQDLKDSYMALFSQPRESVCQMNDFILP